MAEAPGLFCAGTGKKSILPTTLEREGSSKAGIQAGQLIAVKAVP